MISRLFQHFIYYLFTNVKYSYTACAGTVVCKADIIAVLVQLDINTQGAGRLKPGVLTGSWGQPRFP